jgi:outer membrane protein assembly factor BamD
MFRSHLAYLALAAASLLAPCNANAWLWGLFGRDDAWRTIEPAQQDIQAQPLMEEAQTAMTQGRTKHALKLYDKVWEKYPASKYASDALYYTGHINMQRQKWRKAFNAYNILIKAYPENEHFNEMVCDLFQIGQAYEDGINIHYLWIIPYRDRTKAITVYESMVSVAPYSDYAPTALLRVAMLHCNLRELVSAVGTVDRVINDYPNSIETPNATIMMGDYLAGQVDGPAYDQGATNEAMDYYRDFLTLYPANPSVKYCETKLAKNREQYAQSRFLVGVFFYKYRDDYDSAAVFFNDSITIAPESQSAKDARVYLDKIARIKERFPNGNWPRRTEWQFLHFWHKWDPLTEPAPHTDLATTPTESKKAPAAK